MPFLCCQWTEFRFVALSEDKTHNGSQFLNGLNALCSGHSTDWMTTHCVAPSYIDPSTNLVVVKKDVLKHYFGPISGQLLVVSIAGPCKVGKSAFLSYLTGDTGIFIGNGKEHNTKGVCLHGPYSLNSLKRRWQVPELPDDQTQVLFVDTEGLQLSGGRDPTLLMSNMMAPYFAISHVSILMHPQEIENKSISTLRQFFDVTQRICAGANSSCLGENNMVFIDICSGISEYTGSQAGEDGKPIQLRYDGTLESFECASQYIRRLQIRRLAPKHQQFTGVKTLRVDHFWPLPSFNGDYDIFHQSDGFNQGFSLVAKKLLNTLGISKQHMADGQGVFTAFERFVEGLEDENVEELTRICRELQEATAAERFLAPVIEEYVSTAKSQIKSEYWKLVKNIRTNPKRGTPEKDVIEITDECIRKIQECSAVNPAVLRLPKFVTKKENIRTSLLEFDEQCLDHYDAILEDVHRKIMLANLKAFFITETTQDTGIIYETFVRERKAKRVKLFDMIGRLREKWNCLMDRTKDELAISLYNCTEFEQVSSMSFDIFQRDLEVLTGLIMQKPMPERKEFLSRIVKLIFREFAKKLGSTGEEVQDPVQRPHALFLSGDDKEEWTEISPREEKMTDEDVDQEDPELAMCLDLIKKKERGTQPSTCTVS